MAVYVVTGKLGSGKTLVAVSKIQEYLNRGCMIATNLDLNMEYLVSPFSKKTTVYRLSDRPSVDELNALPPPYTDEYDEKKAGLLVFDECATWFNSRTWNDKGRKDLIDWLLHARKLGWDIIFIIQNVSMMDAQAREGFAEMVVHCRRLDRLSIPFVTWFFRLGGINVRPPKVHWGVVKYGASESSPLIERWTYTGTNLYNAYNTRQVFTENSDTLHSVLPANTVYGRHTTHAKHNKRELINSYNKFIENTRPRAAFLIGLLLASVFWQFKPTEVIAQTQIAQQAAKKENPIITTSELDGINITASVKSSRDFDYVFQRGDDAFYPEHLGYAVRFVSECKASLIKDDKTVFVTCSPYRSPSEAPQPREGAVAQRDEHSSNNDVSASTSQSASLIASASN